MSLHHHHPGGLADPSPRALRTNSTGITKHAIRRDAEPSHVGHGDAVPSLSQTETSSVPIRHSLRAGLS